MPNLQRMWAKNFVNFSSSTIRKQNKERLEKERKERLGEDFWKKLLFPKDLGLGKEVSTRLLGKLKIYLLELGSHRRLVFDSGLRNPVKEYRTSWSVPLMAE